MKLRRLNAGIFLALSVTILCSCRNWPDSVADPKCAAYTAPGIEVSCLTVKQARYAIVHVDLNAARIKMLWKNPAGTPYRSLDEASRRFGGDLLAVINAGIYSTNRAPEGLHIEGGVTLSALNLDPGDGNFYWKPNGVFYVTEDGAGVIESEKLASLNQSSAIREATQSGPLLVIDGRINPDFKPDSRSVYVRNGIGVQSDRDVYILVSEDEVNLHDFASVFADQLHCRNALYLDGCVSQLYLPERNSYIPERRRCEKELVGLLGVIKRK
ncbi:MAG TPA: phosphodiester glycosidase family protein [Blastocatellia bacterium]|nr:phosphodiester glycosidase family protein [Blastocatellia bacterium]